MAENSKIEWTTHTANLWHGCTKVHAGCDHCYAETFSKRWNRDIWGNDKPRMEIKSVWNDLLRYQKTAQAAGRYDRVFVGSMMDIFEKTMPMINSKGEPLKYKTGDMRNAFFGAIDAGLFPNLMFLLLTKRPSNINRMIPQEWLTNPPENVMFGTSPVDQETSNKLIPQLLLVNGKRFLSIEPQLDKIYLGHIDADQGGSKEWCQIDCLTGRHTDMARPCEDVPVIHWVINGGESGPGRRPFNTDWAWQIYRDCERSKVPFFMKQIDKVIPVPEDLQIRQFPVDKFFNNLP